MALSNDVDVRNVVSVSVMARLGDDTTVLTNDLKETRRKKFQGSLR